MVRSLLVRGMLAGLLAGVLGFAFAWLVGEQYVDRAIAFEAYVEYTVHHERPEIELVSRQLQSTAGLATGTLIFGVAMGGIFALVFSAVYGRMKPYSARGLAALLGALAFTAVYLVPFLKYPPTPPAVGDPETIRQRTYFYVALIAISVLSMILAVGLRQRLAPRLGEWNASLLVMAGYAAVAAICFATLPGVNEVPQQELPAVAAAVSGDDVTFPPAVLWGFRMSSLGLQAVVWTTIALAFGQLAHRLRGER
jgi:putative cobalt transporter subunit CbtA